MYVSNRIKNYLEEICYSQIDYSIIHNSLDVEDALSGIDAAIAGGFKCVGIGEAATHPQVTYPLKNLAELPDVVLCNSVV